MKTRWLVFWCFGLVVSACVVYEPYYYDECWQDHDCPVGYYCYYGTCYEEWDYYYYYDCGYSEYYYDEYYEYYGYCYAEDGDYFEDDCVDMYGAGWYTCDGGEYCCFDEGYSGKDYYHDDCVDMYGAGWYTCDGGEYCCYD